MKWKPSWIPKVIIAVEEVSDHLHHGFEKAHFVAGLAAKHAKLVVFYCLCSLLLGSKSILPCKICLVPVVRGNVADGRIRCLIWRNDCRLRRNGIDRITSEMLGVLTCVVAVSMPRTAPGALPVVAFSHLVLQCFVNFWFIVEMQKYEIRRKANRGNTKSPRKAKTPDSGVMDRRQPCVIYTGGYGRRNCQIMLQQSGACSDSDALMAQARICWHDRSGHGPCRRVIRQCGEASTTP